MDQFSIELPATVRPLFETAGWYPGRRSWFSGAWGLSRLSSYSFGMAVIRELGGLHVWPREPGEVCFADDISFLRWPTAAHREGVAEVESPGDDLFPIGIAHVGYLEMFVSSRGELVGHWIPDGTRYVFGDSFSEGIERLLLGRPAVREIPYPFDAPRTN